MLMIAALSHIIQFPTVAWGSHGSQSGNPTAPTRANPLVLYYSSTVLVYFSTFQAAYLSCLLNKALIRDPRLLNPNVENH